MKNAARRRVIGLLMSLLILPVSLSGCTSKGDGKTGTQGKADEVSDESQYLVALEEEPDTVDFQCTSIHYTIAQNVFNRLVEMENNAHGSAVVLPSLADKWEMSETGQTYTFHLKEGVTFSNGSPLTASDVEYTFTRLLTHPESCNQDIIEMIKGADKLMNGEADSLEGFEVIDDLDFSITLEQPFSAFPACLSMPGASILDEETTEEAGKRFGIEPKWTIGTGSFILSKWEAGKGMILKANKDCWDGAPKCEGLDLKFISDADEALALFEQGGIDVLDLDQLGSAADDVINDESNKERLYRAHPVGITYIALNESVKPLNNKSVRKALQISVDRNKVLDKVLNGRGEIENGIFPHGLYGHNEELPEIVYDPNKASKLLAKAGYSDGFDLTISVKSSCAQWEKDMMETVASMWKNIGIRAKVEIIDEAEWMSLRKAGQLACYEATWTADYNDPDNFIYTFFGSESNSIFRSLCYPRKKIMDRVKSARTITDKDLRIKEYRQLEETIIQKDAAWIPLFSRLRYYMTGERLGGMKASWNGSVKNNYRNMTIKAD